MNDKIKWRMVLLIFLCIFLTGCSWNDVWFFIFPPVAEKVAASQAGESIHVTRSINIENGDYVFLFLMPVHDCKKMVDADISIQIKSGDTMLFSGSDNFKNMQFAMVSEEDATSYAQEDDDAVLEEALAKIKQGERRIYIKGAWIKIYSHQSDKSSRWREHLKKTIERQNGLKCVGLGFFQTKEHGMYFGVEKSYKNAVIEVHCESCNKITETPMEIWMKQTGSFTSTRKVNNHLCQMRRALNPDLYCFLPDGF